MEEQLLREFLAEAEDLLEVLAGDLQALRAHRAEGRARRELVARIFRHAHTLKGSAASVELEAISRLSHEFETLLDRVRMGRVALDDATLNALDETVAALSQALGAAARDESWPISPTLLERLRRLSFKSSENQQSSSSRFIAALPEELALSLSEYEAHRLREATEEGARLFVIIAGFEFANFDERFRDLSDTLSADGEIISTSPGLEGAAPGQIDFRVVYATELTLEELAAQTSAFGPVQLSEIKPEGLDQPGTDVSAGAANLDQSFIQESIAPLTASVRVGLSELDDVIYAAHELSKECASALENIAATAFVGASRESLETRAAQLRSHFAELEEQLIALRMVTLSRTLKRAARAGLLAARATGKEVEFEIEGEDARLDKSLIDAISDPLLHLVRNAVAHGIETPAERRRAGKEACGRVRLEALAEGSRVRLRILDDGRGIDPELVGRVAVDQGIIPAGGLVSREQALRLIFRPGFSTADSLSSVAGRGIGLDVVENALEQLGGALRVWSEAGLGTGFEMLLPTTLALVNSLLVHSADYLYCIAASQVADTLTVNRNEIGFEGETQVLRWRDKMLPLVRLSQMLDQKREEESASDTLHVIILRYIDALAIEDGEDAGPTSERFVAVAVDGLEGYRKVLVRGLGRYAARWQAVGGAAEMDDGTVALLLDPPRLA
ncbi:MAG TPA: ATP-binding protein [Pyrinomonadaceae bacterium]|jgi:two-component system chemotaxis sensor kinase CheA